MFVSIYSDNDHAYRISVNDALAHPYVSQFSDSDEPTASQPFDIEDNEIDRSVDEWRGIVFCYIKCFRILFISFEKLKDNNS